MSRETKQCPLHHTIHYVDQKCPSCEADYKRVPRSEVDTSPIDSLVEDMRPPMVQALSSGAPAVLAGCHGEPTSAEVRADREPHYGNHVDGATCAGRMWAAMISHRLKIEVPDLPPDLVHLLMCAIKLTRLSHRGGHADSTLDLKTYADMSKEICDAN